MSKIQTALSKLQGTKVAQESVLGLPAAGNAADASHASSVGVLTGVAVHNYGGSSVELNFRDLARQGLTAPEQQAQKVSDEFKVIKRPLLRNANFAEPPLPRGNLWIVTSALAGEGKTFTSVNLALSVARERDQSVVLVDADCAKAHVSSFTGSEDYLGFLDLLRNPQLQPDTIIRPTNIPGLGIMPLGSRDNHASELLSSSTASELLGKLAVADPRRIFLFDSSPLLQTVEASILAAHVGQVVFVVRAGTTPRNAVFDAYQRLDSEAPVNVILTHASAKDSISSYGSYYGNGVAT